MTPQRASVGATQRVPPPPLSRTHGRTHPCTGEETREAPPGVTRTGLQVVGKPGPYYNTKALVRQLEGLIAKLPDPSSPAPPRPDRPRVRTARQLDAEETERLIAGYEAGATVFQLGEGFGIDRRTVGMILKRNGLVSRRGKTPAE